MQILPINIYSRLIDIGSEILSCTFMLEITNGSTITLSHQSLFPSVGGGTKLSATSFNSSTKATVYPSLIFFLITVIDMDMYIV